MLAPAYPVPTSLAEWRRRRPATLRALRRLLGSVPSRPRPVAATILSRRKHAAYLREDLVLHDGPARIPAVLVLPRPAPSPHPAILFHHSHSGDYAVGLEELFGPWPVRESPAVALARRGFAVFAIDAHAFGGRQGRGPGGPAERGREEETSLAKLFLWRGTSLWAMMVRDDLIALDYVAARPEIDAGRIGATGMSMGSTRTWWLAALDERIGAAACIACLTRYDDLVRHRALARHGIYYFVPRMLRHFDAEAVLALIAPRPLLTLTGGRDPGSPVDGVRTLNRFCRRLWALHGRPENFVGRVYPRLGHVYTREMWACTVAWLERRLGGGA